MDAVEVSDLGRSSILTLMIKQMLDQNLRDPEKVRLIRGRGFKAVFKASRMITTIVFEMGRVRIEEGRGPSPDLEIVGDIRTLLELGTGRNPLIPFIKRRLTLRFSRIHGLILTMRVLGLIRLGRLPLYLRALAHKS
jgi:hypothetical protein